MALVGETGAGKSTVMKLLARFYDPDQGAVRVDGLDLRALDLHQFRRQLGYVPQEAFLFTGTIRDNIAYGNPEAGNDAVEAAARAVGAHDFIADLPGGYLHELLERGRSLSSGQRQLIALARAELVDPAILLLDEATSNLDLSTESRVAEAMQRVSANGRRSSSPTACRRPDRPTGSSSSTTERSPRWAPTTSCAPSVGVMPPCGRPSRSAGSGRRAPEMPRSQVVGVKVLPHSDVT